MKRVAKQHKESPCVEKTWGDDNRYTICEMCGKQRFYPWGWNGTPSKCEGKKDD